MPVKKATSKKTSSLRASAKQSSLKTEIAASTASPRNDTKKSTGLSIPVYGLDGKESGNLELSKEIFGARVNKPLLSQAIRVYQNNQKSHFANTKTRGEVRGSTRKLFKQKGTGNARRGSLRSPIARGGGIALGPKFRKVELELPKKMKRLALISALSSKMLDGEIFGLDLAKVSGKTSEIFKLFKTLDKKNALIVVDQDGEKLVRAVSNLPSINSANAANLNVLEIIRHTSLVLTKEAVLKLESRIKNDKSKTPEEEK